ncbi:MAG: hypothetical protein CVV03_02265 [Firmicutes bacterium HGW-Firmicutes-8]|nr:MAG: hypothetical protein CVV03_02265 [Firmicutes bacterium HGW-Firmicutes-8]
MVFSSSFEDIKTSDIEFLQTRGVKEFSQLDFKRELLPLNQDGKFELLKDISAMANADGGFIIYGVEQDSDGAPANLPGLEIQDTDHLQNQIDQIISSGIEEAIYGVRHRSIARNDGRYYYIIKIPSSYLAPHMINIQTTKPRFYQRMNTVNVPLNVRQIKEAVLKMQGAEQKAIEYIQGRKIKLSQRLKKSFYTLHIFPLYGRIGSLDLTSGNVTEKLVSLGDGNPRYTIDGFSIIWHSGDSNKHSLVGRNGSVEFMRSPITTEKGNNQVLRITAVEELILANARAVAKLSVDGFAHLPVLIGISYIGVQNSYINGPDGFPNDNIFEEREINCDPVIIHDWCELEKAAKDSFDFIWQTYGFPQCPNYTPEGNRITRG